MRRQRLPRPKDCWCKQWKNLAIREEKPESRLATAAGFVGVFGEVVQQGKEC